MKSKNLKKKVAFEVLKFIPNEIFIGVGTGSTVTYLINYLKKIKNKIKGAVSSSYKTTMSLKKNGIKVVQLNSLDRLPLYIDSADEINNNMEMIKGGGAALTREKILASAADKFICIIDETKQVKTLGKFPLPIEVLPMSYRYVMRELKKIGGEVKKRSNIITDNNNYILDISKLCIVNPVDIENTINNIPGVISVGIFSRRKPDILLVSTKKNVKKVFIN
ncbi:ribose-5-phosphate isomerase RpiA [Buchnera aphidicola]|uniref:ribose-5-phosphate isomerase RpiA n=1 Tax=Buchnera aphidicola TaxID=9 RepID=UPI0020936EDA|nr:ribose-5-phosphate isomerase RpiA [Buchnera aphidicola]USS94394.1 ribose-5-phosphate isomerase RpiA [Buchnera aphidicola (Sipha maydis)]WII23554.1 ribose-5-phosphate isomerase RpiA [Buchnera aphidicola (Sipha maydis)]